MPEYTQADRPMRIDTALAEDVLLLERFEGTEAISTPFSYEVDLLSEDRGLDPDDLLRTPMLITVQGVADEPRVIHGLVNRFVQLGQAERLTSYRAHVVPWLWFLSLRKDCKIFQEMTVLEIVEEVFQAQGYSDFKDECTRDYPKREYCVQYRESSFAFVSRLLEEEGIYYFFEHSDSKHVLVLADDNSSIRPCPGQETARAAQEPSPDEDVVTLLQREHAVSSGMMTLNDYDPLQPSLQLLSSITGTEPEEVYDYPGKYTDLEEGERYARIRLETYEAQRHVVHGESTCRLFRSGYRFGLTGHYRPDTNQDYALVQIHHSGAAGDYRSWGSAPLDYRNNFLAIPHAVPYRPPQRTAKPVVRGSQTAVVVGKAGEEVWVDEHGRIKIQFHWDRDGQRNEHSSCWVRVATPWGGKRYGKISLPRIGNEVVVDFLEGDPDRPLVTGSVYNAEQTPPFDLPASKVRMGIKSRSSPGGGGFNEITLTDDKGEELINIHAQKDMTTTVLNNDTQTVQANRAITVNGKHTETIKKDTSITISEGNLTLTVSKGTATVTVEKAVTETFNATQTTNVKKKIAITSSEAEVHVTAATEIKLVSGSSSLLLKKDGTINLVGKKILINGEDQVNVSGKKISASAGDEAKLGVGNQNVTCDKQKVGVSGAAINSSAVGMHEITGAVVKIN